LEGLNHQQQQINRLFMDVKEQADIKGKGIDIDILFSAK